MPLLSEQARHLVIPKGITKSAWPRINTRLAEMGVEYDWWQEGAAKVALGRRRDGKYAASVGGVVWSVPRQVGKTFLLGSLMVAMCLEYPGLRVVWTSHHLRTTGTTFQTMQGFVRRPEVFPSLAPNGIRLANGEQEIRFANGSAIMFGAREQGFGRGIPEIDVLIFDEAQKLGLKALEDMVPTTNRYRHEHGALLFFIGTPPRPVDDGEAFSTKRSQAIEGKSSDTFYLEFSADPDADPDDRKQWEKANPSYPKFTPVDAMLRMRENMPSEDSWMREALGVWDASSANEVIAHADWADIADPEAEISGPISIGVDVSPDRRSACVALAGETTDGRWLVAMREHKTGTVDWVVPFVESFKARNTIRAVVIEKASAAAALMDDMEKRRIRVTAAQAHDMAGACGLLYDGVYAGWLTHPGQPQLAYALSMARKRPMLNGGAWGWNKKSADSDITPVVAVTLALWGAKNSTVRRNPNPNPNRTPGRTSGRRVMGRR